MSAKDAGVALVAASWSCGERKTGGAEMGATTADASACTASGWPFSMSVRGEGEGDAEGDAAAASTAVNDVKKKVFF